MAPFYPTIQLVDHGATLAHYKASNMSACQSAIRQAIAVERELRSLDVRPR